MLPYLVTASFSSFTIASAVSIPSVYTGSQFFIVTTDSAFLDRQYTVFGEVTDGMETADAIVKLEKDGNDCPLQDAKMTKVTVT